MVFCSLVAALPPDPSGGGVFLEDVALSVPELDGRGYGHVIEYPHAQFAGGVAAQDRTEKDGFEVGNRCTVFALSKGAAPK